MLSFIFLALMFVVLIYLNYKTGFTSNMLSDRGEHYQTGVQVWTQQTQMAWFWVVG